MPSHCLLCGQDYEGLYMWCPSCQGMCKSSSSYGLKEMLSGAPILKDEPRPTQFYQGKQSQKYHTKSDPDGPTIANVRGQKRGGRPAKMEVKTQRQTSTLARHVSRLNAGEGSIISTYESSNGTVKIFMLDSSAPRKAPSFYGVKRDGVTFPIHPTDENIPEIYRAPEPEYDSDSDTD